MNTSSLQCSWLVLAMSAALLGCNLSFSIDPEGYQCDEDGSCPIGYRCMAGVCRSTTPKTCGEVLCDQVPSSSCMGNVLRSYAAHCNQELQTCEYNPFDTNCEFGCSDGACINQCNGVSCNAPPATRCNGASLVTYSANGTCNPQSGVCEYGSTETPCTFGCDTLTSQCHAQDLCQNVTCSTVPDAMCMGHTARTFKLPGTCNSSTGQCAYGFTDVECTGGCSRGACVVPLTFVQIGPRVPFAANAIDVASGLTGAPALAIGNGGKVARWNGTDWAVLASNSTSDLRDVHFVSNLGAVIVGTSKTVLTFRNDMITTQLGVPGLPTVSFQTVFGRDFTNVLVGDDQGGWYKWNSTTWTNGTLPATNTPYIIRAGYIDETGRERLAGTCKGTTGTKTCVAYRFPASGNNWFTDTDSDSLGCDALGPWVAPLSATPEVLCGKPDNTLTRHSTAGTFTPVTQTLSVGAGIVGISLATIAHDVFVLTSSVAGTGALYHLSASTTGMPTATNLLSTFAGEEHLSKNEGNGIVVAEVLREANHPGTNNILRRSMTGATTALDIGENLAGVSTDTQRNLIIATTSGDVAIRKGTSATYEFYRGPRTIVNAVEARNGNSVLLVGRAWVGNTGVIAKMSSTGVFVAVPLAQPPGVSFKSVCRVSDTEAYAVGTSGTIFSINSNAATAASMPSSTTRTLNSVDCAGSTVFACGSNGTVLELANGAWRAHGVAFLNNKDITWCQTIDGALFAGGNDFFAKLEPGATSWASLPTLTGLTTFVGRTATDVYAISGTQNSSDINIFDGTTWSKVSTVSEVIAGGVQIGAKVVFAGAHGALVDGR